MNIGFELRIAAGMVLSADYVRNVGLHYLLATDINHRAMSSFNAANALTAVDATPSARAASATAAAAPGGDVFPPDFGDFERCSQHRRLRRTRSRFRSDD